MTTTVRVQARAWGARVEVQGQDPVDVGPNQERAFHIAEGESLNLTVTHGEKPAENDRLLGGGAGATNESGADETARDTSGATPPPPSKPQLGRGSRGPGAE